MGRPEHRLWQPSPYNRRCRHCRDLFTGKPNEMLCRSCKPRRRTPEELQSWAMLKPGPGGVISSDDPRREAAAEALFFDDPKGSDPHGGFQ